MWKLRPGQQFSNLSTHRGHLERFLGPWASVPRLQLALLAWGPHLENHNSKEFWDYFQSNGEPRNSHCVLDSTGLRFLQSRNDSDDYFPSLFRPLLAPPTQKIGQMARGVLPLVHSVTRRPPSPRAGPQFLPLTVIPWLITGPSSWNTPSGFCFSRISHLTAPQRTSESMAMRLAAREKTLTT